jgi:hypothetical protein
MKKIISIMLALVLVLSFAACARQAENGESTTAAGGDNAIISVGNGDIADKSGTEIARGTQDGNTYQNDALGIKITPPESFESLSEEEVGATRPSRDYFVIELTDNHEGIAYKTVSVSITEGTEYADAQAYISFIQADNYMQTENLGTVNIGGREYACVRFVYTDAPDSYHAEYISVENGTLVILGFDQMTDAEITEFFNNYIEQY